jgi:hypothetical protein
MARAAPITSVSIWGFSPRLSASLCQNAPATRRWPRNKAVVQVGVFLNSPIASARLTLPGDAVIDRKCQMARNLDLY